MADSGRVKIYREHQVHSGETLAELAEANGLSWQELAEFNWSTSVPHEINLALHEYVGCNRRTGDNKNYMFDDADDPGIIYIPVAPRALRLPTTKTHVIEVQRPRLWSQVDIETVDEFGCAQGNVELLLKPLEGQPETTLTSDQTGFIRQTKIRAGRYRIALADGSPTWYLIDANTPNGPKGDPEFGRFVPAILNTAHHSESLTTVVVSRSRTPEEREERRRIKQRYLRTGQQETLEGAGEETKGLSVRSAYLAADNLAIAAGCVEDGDEPLVRLTGPLLSDWLAVSHPATVADGYYVLLYRPDILALELWDSGERSFRFTIRKEFQDFAGLLGAYGFPERVTGEDAEDSIVLFRDLATGVAIIGKVLKNGEGSRAYSLTEIVGEPERLIAEQNARAGKRPIVYYLPSAADVAAIALSGGAGRLDDYGHGAAGDARLHNINVLVCEHIAAVYNSYLRGYIKKVQATTNEDALRHLGPPRTPFEMPMPASATSGQKEQLLDALYTSELQAWEAIAEQLDLFANRKVQGRPFLRVKFKTAASTAYYNRIKDTIRPGLPKLPEAKWLVSDLEVETNIDLHYVGGSIHTIQKTDASYKFGVKMELPRTPGDQAPGSKDDIFDALNHGMYMGETPKGFPLEFTIKTDIDLPDSISGEQRALLDRLGGPLKSMALRVGPYKMERKANGTVKFSLEMGKDFFAVNSFADSYNGEFGSGFTFKTKPLANKVKKWMEEKPHEDASTGPRNFTPEQKLVVESFVQFLDSFEMEAVIGFTGTREETVLAVVSRAPGFFERRSTKELLSPNTQWNDLNYQEQVMLVQLGWNQRLWELKYWLPEKELPKGVNTPGYKLSPTEKVAIVHLGFYTYDEYSKSFSKNRAEYNPQGPTLFFMPM